MRKLTALLSMSLALSASAAELWRWRDADGVMHYSDRPVQGAERIDVQMTQKSTGAIPARSPQVTEGRPEVPAPESENYTRCAVASPTDQQVFNAVSAVNARIDIEPGLQRGHKLQVFLNGSAFVDWPATQFAYTLVDLYRGSYTLSVRVIDANGRALCTGSTVNFHVRQPSVLAPARKPPPSKPPAKP
jgi:Domain of unknown function (DUF4124)